MIDPDLAYLIIKNARDYAVLTLTPEGRIVAWSRGAEHIFGFSADEVVGHSFQELFVESDVAAGVPQDELSLALSAGRAEDTRWHRRKNGQRFWANGVTMRLGDRSELIKVLRDETAAKLAEEQRILLLNELNHRIKNTLVTVQSIVEQTLRAEGVALGTRQVLTDRLIALAEAHNVLVNDSWAGADLHTIVERALGAHLQPRDGRFHLDGPCVMLSPQQAVPLSLVLHELTTNAIKHGALSVGGGQVSLTWNLAHDGMGQRRMTLLWQERGGPVLAAAPPGREGFGMRLIARSFGQDGDGRTQIAFAPEGVRCIIHIPLSEDDSHPILDLGAAKALEISA
ncbi:sensor histidine kinase [Phenylobacterium sp.]|uniref:sensor histidine kinase n=1 Tax=Phenylobacterium sp. TaxID=1871053 RepID=UPI0027318DE8|nr:HWE histidine kinase domain-containing protein [Phenylobacterium sp.]MDP1617429.1 HWE histidine kinase domain-containing protein [Phenylobacterium sp.]MDP1987466.1 HWE histidine kinase domain-containing protein [Phenylobacterium sp.]